MLFTAHLFDTSPLVAARRSAPDPGDVPGLWSSRNGVCAQFSHSFVPSPQLGREAILACRENEDAVDQFLADDPLGRVAATGWHVRLKLVCLPVGVSGDDLVTRLKHICLLYTSPSPRDS